MTAFLINFHNGYMTLDVEVEELYLKQMYFIPCDFYYCRGRVEYNHWGESHIDYRIFT